jgi:hypothetical protein
VSITWNEESDLAVSSLAGACDALDRFGLALQQCEQADEQIALALEAVREGLSADVVFWHPGTTADPFAVSGSVSLSADWARVFLAHVCPHANNDRLVRQFLDPGAKPMAPWPCSAALVRISRSHGSWLVALSFHPRRLFRLDELHVLRLARRMLLNQRPCGRTDWQSVPVSLDGLPIRPTASDHAASCAGALNSHPRGAGN